MPLSLCHFSGNFNKTDKSKLLNILEKQVVNHGQPESNDVLMYDGFFLLHLMQNVPATFGEISLKVLEKITGCGSKIFLLFDVHKEPSIKDNEHVIRDNFSRDVKITGKLYSFYYYNYNVKFKIKQIFYDF